MLQNDSMLIEEKKDSAGAESFCFKVLRMLDCGIVFKLQC